MGHFVFFQLINNYAETTLLIDKTYISQQVSHTAQQESTKDKSPKICLKFNFEKNFGFYVVKIIFFDYQAKLFSLVQVFGGLNLL